MVGLVLGTLALGVGALFLLADFLALDRQDQVHPALYVVPLAVGSVPWVVFALWLAWLYVAWVRRMIRDLRQQREAHW